MTSTSDQEYVELALTLTEIDKKGIVTIVSNKEVSDFTFSDTLVLPGDEDSDPVYLTLLNVTVFK